MMPKSTPCRRGRGGDDGREEGSHGGYPNLTVRHDFASAKASPAASESLKPEIGRYAREMEEESSRIDVDSRKTKRGNRTHEPAYEAPRIAPCMPEAPEAGEMPTISTLLRSFWHRAETQSEIDQVAHLHAERVRDPSQLLEPDLDLPLLDAGDVGVGVGLADHARERALREALRQALLADRLSEPLVFVVLCHSHVPRVCARLFVIVTCE